MAQALAPSIRPLPDPAQIAALRALRDQFGRDWKAHLLADWITQPDNPHQSPDLCRLRRSHGPSWLLDYTLPDR
ncbi:hypothetical protein [Paracoccus sulfuroxidans]|uniref:Uncharacterized protein n=1 Tax=Paracoccus sulfuroxidans TaxID=384678 RepID=A0A562N6L1_9RHOB|nr:hypothetical protein [Paracoccus sulfuroxidans]TWI27787.1 hypothetical protein IQ24_03983 [Paracoccus sulfuroxidans]